MNPQKSSGRRSARKSGVASNGLPLGFNYYDRQLSMSLTREELANRLCEAKSIASSIGMEIDWDDVARCGHCEHSLVDIICQLRHKGAIFHLLSTMPESIFRNCGGGIKGYAVYQGKTYGVDADGYVQEIDVGADSTQLGNFE